MSPAAIGYHFGGVKKLMVTAAFDAARQWGLHLVESLGSVPATGAGTAPRAAAWDAVVASFDGHRAGVLQIAEVAGD